MATLPPAPARDGGAAALLALAIFLAPAVGVPSPEMLQDTLKSAVVSFGALLAAGLFFRAQRERGEPLRWHPVLWLPVVLCAYALGSMLWSHRYLAAVEAIRWFVFGLVAWLALNTLTRERLPRLAWAIHAGALVASLWAALQFWFDAGLFPQGPQPASTFVNRNFFAEFVACSLPFSALLLARARSMPAIGLLAASNGFLVTALLMTGTRSALIALWLQLLVLYPVAFWRCRDALASASWTRAAKWLALAVFTGTVLVLGAIPTGSQKIVQEGHGATPLERGLVRTRSIEPHDYSLGLRLVMWRATLDLIRANPVAGVGAGAWEVQVPRYQEDGAQLETDYYVHNEFLQLVAEYGVVGWAALLLLVASLARSGWRTWRAADAQERPWRAAVLCSLLALMVASSIGFPWRLAATGMLFALGLGALAASDARLGVAVRPLPWSPQVARGCLIATAACLLLAAVITERAAAAERLLVRAAESALTITRSGRPDDPMFDPLKRKVLEQVQEGIAINPHYRKITPIVADELARWGDWRRATWIWESVLGSRPYIVAIITNVARGYGSMGRDDIARAYLERARALQPRAPAVRSLEVLLLARSGQEERAAQLAREALDAGIVDHDLVNTAFVLAWRARDYPRARRLLQQRMAQWPETRARGEEQMAELEAEAKAAQTSASRR